ncbi:hypothetical protein CCAND95_330024 [Capnocytophaga canis]|uniref:Uncharacterized protein n=1 Tax=Capnocytophaga canis TaxID=1848903 RepID=A0A0B7I782_9FLAO|nr:hypothetical protein CCAND95_330024 [Capnocytophaga canis]CEN45917.1 hypothetical protein CCAND38_300009 [Capnocytophaga canis]CEN54357.1 hypothetical protein CCAND93_840041 [Capnocytophaga canis]
MASIQKATWKKLEKFGIVYKNREEILNEERLLNRMSSNLFSRN